MGTAITLDQLKAIVHAHIGGENKVVVNSFKELPNNGYSYTKNIQTYIIDLTTKVPLQRPCCSFLTIDASSESKDVLINTIHTLIASIREHTDIPIPQPMLDTSCSIIPYPFILSPAAPLPASNLVSLASIRSGHRTLPLEASLMIDLQIGKFLGQMHSKVQNDFFGLPGKPITDAGLSWQETFTGLLEEALSQFEEGEEQAKLGIPFQPIRQYLSRAIGSFLFDDVEVPSLVWFAGSEHDIYILLPDDKTPSGTPPGLAAILPNLAHATWGDPLMESFFIPPNPSQATLEGYLGSGGQPLTVFARQKTKRIWYDLYLALTVLKERRRSGLDGSDSQGQVGAVDEEWATKLLFKSVDALKDAPCY